MPDPNPVNNLPIIFAIPVAIMLSILIRRKLTARGLLPASVRPRTKVLLVLSVLGLIVAVFVGAIGLRFLLGDYAA